MNEKDAIGTAEVMLSLGGSYSEVLDFLSTSGVLNAAAVIRDTVTRWVADDKTLLDGRRAIQRRRLMRQVRLAMEASKVGDAVRAEAILARLDDQEAEAEANRTKDDFETELERRSEEEINFYVVNERWPEAEDLKPAATAEEIH
jgi:hypothetical protein